MFLNLNISIYAFLKLLNQSDQSQFFKTLLPRFSIVILLIVPLSLIQSLKLDLSLHP